MRKTLLLLLLLFQLLSQSTVAQRVFKSISNIEKKEIYEYGYSKGFIKMQNDTLLVCKDFTTINIFDNKQNLLLEYSKKGKGPGELLKILGMLIYKNQLVLLDNVNNKVVYLTFEKEPKLVKEVPIRELGHKLFIVNDTLIVKHSLKDYIMAEYNDEGEIISTYPQLSEDDSYTMFVMNGDFYFEEDTFYLYKRNNLEVTSFKRHSKTYSTDKVLRGFNSYSDVNYQQVDLNSIKKGVHVYNAPVTAYSYYYTIVKYDLHVINIENNDYDTKNRIVDIYDWRSKEYKYSYVIDVNTHMGGLVLFYPNQPDNFYVRTDDLSIFHVSFTLE